MTGTTRYGALTMYLAVSTPSEAEISTTLQVECHYPCFAGKETKGPRSQGLMQVTGLVRAALRTLPFP